jgi:hypothetical protein
MNMTELSVTELSVTDGTIPNLARGRADTWRTIRQRPRLWAARVWLDQSEPGGLYREFLPLRALGEIVVAREIELGDVIEFAERRATFKPNERADARVYFQVDARREGVLVGRIVGKESCMRWADYVQARHARREEQARARAEKEQAEWETRARAMAALRSRYEARMAARASAPEQEAPQP